MRCNWLECYWEGYGLWARDEQYYMTCFALEKLPKASKCIDTHIHTHCNSEPETLVSVCNTVADPEGILRVLIKSPTQDESNLASLINKYSPIGFVSAHS